MLGVLLKALGAWMLLVVFAILNAALREKVLAPGLGETMALPLSGITLSIMIICLTLLVVPYLGVTQTGDALLVGCCWLVLTLAFELLLGRFVVGGSWREVLQVFNLKKGDLFSLVLLVTLVAPWLSARLRGIF